MSNETQITYISWPPLWIYWPIYLAMEKTQRTVEGLRFVRETPPAASDEKIRKRFSEMVRRRARPGRKPGNFTMALCEPGSARNGSDRLLRGLRIRKLPLVWRQPHWVITRREDIPELADYLKHSYERLRFFEKPLDTLPRGAIVYCYPRDTTSGDYVRSYFQKIEMRSRKTFTLMNVNIRNERSVWSKKGKNYLASFTPWHQFDVRLAAISELPGAVRDITALLIPEQETDHPHLRVGELYHRLSVNLKQILASFDETQGDPRHVEAYVKKYHQRVCDFVNVSTEVMPPGESEVDAEWKDPEVMIKFLTEYIRRGCYFPYQVIEEAFGSELSYLLEDEAGNYKDRLVESTKEGLNRLFGLRQDWSELSFEGRINAQIRWEPKSPDNPGGDPRTLCEYLTHLHQEKSAKTYGRQSAFEMINVQTGETEDAVALIRFNGRDRLFFCADRGAGSTGGTRPIFGHCSLAEGHINAQEAREHAQEPFNPCLACVVSGLPGALLRGGAKMLAEEIVTTYPAEISPDNPPPPLATYRALLKSNSENITRTFGTLLCWWDVEPFFKIFCSEMRQPNVNGQHPPCLVVMVGDDSFAKKGTHHLLLAIFWRGGTNPGKSGVGARGKLLSWAREQSKAGREVGLVRLWFRGVEGSDGQGRSEPVHPPRDSGSDPLLATSVKELWDAARELAREGSYHFAYVTVFNYPPVPEEAGK